MRDIRDELINNPSGWVIIKKLDIIGRSIFVFNKGGVGKCFVCWDTVEELGYHNIFLTLDDLLAAFRESDVATKKAEWFIEPVIDFIKKRLGGF